MNTDKELRAKLSALEVQHDLPPLPFLTWTRLYKTDELIEIATAYSIQAQAVIRAKLEGQETAVYRYKFKEDLQWQYTVNKSQAHRLSVIEPLYLAAGAKGKDVNAELVEALERIKKHHTTDMYWASGIARDALSRVKAQGEVK